MAISKDDIIVINFPGGQRRAFAKDLNITDWPPPEEITVGGMVYIRIRYSQLTDEQLEACPNICRGAEYNCKPAANDGS